MRNEPHSTDQLEDELARGLTAAGESVRVRPGSLAAVHKRVRQRRRRRQALKTATASVALVATGGVALMAVSVITGQSGSGQRNTVQVAATGGATLPVDGTTLGSVVEEELGDSDADEAWLVRTKPAAQTATGETGASGAEADASAAADTAAVDAPVWDVWHVRRSDVNGASWVAEFQGVVGECATDISAGEDASAPTATDGDATASGDAALCETEAVEPAANAASEPVPDPVIDLLAVEQPELTQEEMAIIFRSDDGYVINDVN